MLSCLPCSEGSVHCILGNSWQVGNNSLSFLLVTIIITQINTHAHTERNITISYSAMVETFYWLLLFFLYWVVDIFTFTSYLVCFLGTFCPHNGPHKPVTQSPAPASLLSSLPNHLTTKNVVYQKNHIQPPPSPPAMLSSWQQQLTFY